MLFSNFKDTTSLRVTMQQVISTTYKYTSKKENAPTNRGLFHDFRFSLGYDNLQQDGISEAVGSLTVFLHTAGKGASCPYCGHFSHRLHSYYSRHIEDLEVYGHTLELVIKVGKYYCDNVSCPQKIFCEPLSFLARRYGRRSYLVEERIRSISLELTSRKASSLLQLFHITASSSSCLRILQQCGQHNPMHNKSIYVGIDDFAYKKGKDYMSVVVDQMTHIPIALLEDRNGEALDNWLIRNPQIQYITRDRGRCFTEAINRIIPGVTQICDRFHLIKNMTDTMIPEIEKIIRQTKKKLKYEYPDRDTASSLILQDIFNMGDVRHREKLKIYRESLNLKMQGMTIEQTATHLGKKSRYIYKIIHNRRIGAYLNEQQKTALKYVSELATIISAGCITRKILAQKMGSKISGALIGRITSSLRKRYQQKRKEVKEHNESIENRSKIQRVSQNQIRKYILKGESDNPKLAELYKSSPQIKELLSVCQNFRDMINGNTYDKDIRKWIEKAKATRNMALTNFAYGIEKDWEAVQAAIDIPFSNGLLEGTVNKIKAVKRQMYNRAGIKLLERRLFIHNRRSTTKFDEEPFYG